MRLHFLPAVGQRDAATKAVNQGRGEEERIEGVLKQNDPLLLLVRSLESEDDLAERI